MKKFLLLLIMGGFLTSCNLYNYKTIPLKGDYYKPPFVVESKNNFEATWSRLVDLFAQNNFSIRIIDKSSGLIVLNRADLTNAYTAELANGKTVTNDKYVVVSRCYNSHMDAFAKVDHLAVDWNVRVKSDNDKVFVNINMVNTIVERVVYVDKRPYKLCPDAEVRSTGLLEKQIAAVIK